MDRRTYLAFALVIGVLIIHSLFFAPKQEPQQQAPPVSSDSTQVVTTPVAPAIEPPKPSTVAPRDPYSTALHDPIANEELHEIVRVETDLVSAEFDPVGAAVRSWKLREYTDAAEEPADLVRTRDLGALWFAIRQGGRVIRTDSTRFRSSVHRDGTETLVRFIAEDTLGLTVQMTYRIPVDRYDCRLEISVDGMGGAGSEGAYELGWVDGLPILERDPKSDHMSIASVALFGKEYVRVGGRGGAFGCAGGGGGFKSEVHEGTLQWFGVRNKYFLGALLLDEPQDRKLATQIDGDDHSAGVLLSEPLSYSGHTKVSYRLYLGPIHYGLLSSHGVGLERVQDLGPGILRPFSKLVMRFFQAAHHVVPNYGWEILILSILIRLIFYPLTKKSMESMKRMQQLKPEMDRINEKYKDDPERKNREVMDLYRKKKINPLGSCLPMLVQLPVLSGLFYVLSNAVELRKEPFALWIQDLSAPDTVAHIAGFPINPMPLIMAATTVWQQRITPTDPRQKSIGYMMPIFFTILFYSMSSGLVFYWTVSNLMTVLQQIWMNRGSEKQEKPKAKAAEPVKVEPEPEPEPSPEPTPRPKPKRRKSRKK